MTLPAGLLQLDAEAYRNPAELPPGAVLVVGSGQSGCQIAEELCEAGRDVFLSCGRAGWAPRRLGGHDLFWWLLHTGDLDDPVSSLPSPAARLGANIQATGRDGGHDLHYRTLQRLGVTLLGHFRGSDGRRVRFAPDLADSIAWGDQRNAKFMDRIRAFARERGMSAPEILEPEPLATDSPETLDLSEFGAVVFAGGFRPDYESWIHCPGAFDDLGFPTHDDGASTAVAGLYFVGVHFLRKRKSALLLGVGEDATLVAERIAARAARRTIAFKTARKRPNADDRITEGTAWARRTKVDG
jgi:putative flavoprotein involved in K+ transport